MPKVNGLFLMTNETLAAITFCIFLTAAVVANASDFGDMKRVDVSSSLNITFNANDDQYIRIRAERNQHKEGWIEDGTWHASGTAGIAEVRVFVASLYTKAFQKKHAKEIRERLDRFFGHSDLVYGEQGILKTNSGPIDYIFYRMGSQGCVFIRKYWSDPGLQGDIDPLSSTFSWIAGSNYILAYFCKPSRGDLRMEDMVRLFNGIEAKNIYWPSDMFTSVGIDDGYTETSEYLDKLKDQSSNFTGSYHSELTGNWGLALGLDSAIPEVKLEQNGSEIEGSYGLKGGKIFGQVDGGTVNFRWVGSGSRSGTGKWTFKKGSNDIEGSWTSGHGIEMSGTWNLRGDPEWLGNDSEQANYASTPPPEFDLSGIYTSKVIKNNNNDYWCFNQKRTFQIKLKQDGNKILGAFLSGITGEIKGTIVNNKVTFNWYTTRCSGGSEGQWTVGSGGSNLQGFGNSEIVWEAQKNN